MYKLPQTNLGIGNCTERVLTNGTTPSSPLGACAVFAHDQVMANASDLPCRLVQLRMEKGACAGQHADLTLWRPLMTQSKSVTSVKTAMLIVLLAIVALLAFLVLMPKNKPTLADRREAPSTEWTTAPDEPGVPVNLPKTLMRNGPTAKAAPAPSPVPAVSGSSAAAR